MRICANPNCTNEFEPRTVSNIYCGAACRIETTNNNLIANYWRKKEIKEGKLQRQCRVCNITKLSRYNKHDTCEPCQEQVKEDARAQLLKELGVA